MTTQTYGSPNAITNLGGCYDGDIMMSGQTGQLGGGALISLPKQTFRSRGICSANMSVTAFVGVTGGTAQDGVTYVAGERTYLANQTTSAENGLYIVGAVASGTAPLTRAPEMLAGVVLNGGFEVKVSEGTLFANTTWKCTTTGLVTVATTTTAHYPQMVRQSLPLVAGTVTITNTPILSATKTAVHINRTVANTSTLTVGGYHPTVGGATGMTVGVVGTGQVVIEATVGAGTINNADISTLTIAIVNW